MSNPYALLSGYELRHLPGHLGEAGCWDALEDLLTDLPFLEAKAGAGHVHGLAGDFAAAVDALPTDRPRRPMLRLLGEGLRQDIQFLARHPGALFQCLWNSCWWYDCPDAADHYDPPEGGWPSEGPPWLRPGTKLYQLLEAWRTERSPAPWLRSLWPPALPLGSGQQAVLRGHAGRVDAVAVSPCGRHLASLCNAGGGPRVRLWDVARGEQTAAFSTEVPALSLCFAADARHLVTGSKDGAVRLLDAGGTERACLRGHDRTARGPEPAHSDRPPASPDDEDSVVYDRGTDPSDADTSEFCYGPAQVFAVAWCPVRGLIASGADDHTVRLWDLASGTEVRCLHGHEGEVAAVAFSPDGRLVASASWDETVRVWDVDSGGEVGCLRGHTDRALAVAFHPGGGLLASGSTDRTVRVWDLAGGRELHCLKGYAGAGGVAFTPDGRLVAGAVKGAVRAWDPRSGTEVACLGRHGAAVTAIAASPDGSFVLSASEDATLRLWDPGGGSAPPVLRLIDGQAWWRRWRGVPSPAAPSLEAGEEIGSFGFSPDGRTLALLGRGLSAYAVRLFDAQTGRERPCPDGHSDRVTLFGFVSGGLEVLTGSVDATIRRWDVLTGEQRSSLRVAGRVMGLLPSPGGTASPTWRTANCT
jgi:WD40 repeat protein